MSSNGEPPIGGGSLRNGPDLAPPTPTSSDPRSRRECLDGIQQSEVQPISSSSLHQSSPGFKDLGHNRTVSWGVPMASPYSPPPLGGVNFNRLPQPSPPTPVGGTASKTDKFGISDVINAGGCTETEAETYIMQAVEKISIHHRTNTEESCLYSNIVENEVCRTKSETETDEDETGYGDGPTTSRFNPTKQTPHLNLTRNPSKFQGLIPQHKESNSVEGTLFGLTSALKELDQASHTTYGLTERQDEAQDYETNFSSADKLANAAQKMLQGGNLQDREHCVHDAAAEDDTHHSSIGSDKKTSRRRRKGTIHVASKGAKEEWEVLNTYFTTGKDRMKSYVKKIAWMIILPSFGISFFLFYVVENPALCLESNVNVTEGPSMSSSQVPSYSPSVAPTSLVVDPWLISWVGNETPPTNIASVTFNETQTPTGTEDDELLLTVCSGLGASISWWFLFMGVRQVITFSMALITQSLIIDYLALSSRVMLSTFGPIVTLLLVQSKGWPFVIVFWAFFDLILLCGNAEFQHHWGYWQNWIGLFNEENPSGNVVNNEWNRKILVNAIIVGVAVAIKRLVVGLFLGRQTFAHYGEHLATVMKSMVLVGEVATLARQIECTKEDYLTFQRDNSDGWEAFMSQEADEAQANADEGPIVASAADAANAFIASRQSKIRSDDTKANESQSVATFEPAVTSDPEFTESQQIEMANLLDAWEEPKTAVDKEEKKPTIGAVLQFRQALTFMKKKYPFLPAFGPADSRQACIESSQKIYDKLLLRTPHQNFLPFETLAILAKKDDGTIDKEKAKEIIRAFRPNRDGTLGKLEWVKSVDVIYKEMRLLSANISNSGQMDAAVENLINIAFYIALGCVIIYRLGQDPLALFISFSTVLLAFTFLIGKASSKYFNGCLFILVQRPYGVGDRIHLSNPQNETSPDGSSGWIVEKVSLFSTNVYWGTTNEKATLCNGAICYLRVINAARSPNAIVSVQLRFGIDTPNEKIEIFRTALEQFLKDRPREWLTFVGFRPNEVVTDKGYIGYKVIAQHRNSWQDVGSIFESKANLTTYCLEVAKQLEMRYLSPPLPVDLTIKDHDGLTLPILGEIPFENGPSTDPEAAPVSTCKAAWAVNNLGLRQRGGKSRFADLVQQVVDANKDK